MTDAAVATGDGAGRCDVGLDFDAGAAAAALAEEDGEAGGEHAAQGGASVDAFPGLVDVDAHAAGAAAFHDGQVVGRVDAAEEAL